MNADTAVKILDTSGTILGITKLGPGQYEDNRCVFNFSVQLDDTSTHYQIVIGSRDPYDFDDVNAVHLSLGPR
jgi:hypothetical protein